MASTLGKFLSCSKSRAESRPVTRMTEAGESMPNQIKFLRGKLLRSVETSPPAIHLLSVLLRKRPAFNSKLDDKTSFEFLREKTFAFLRYSAVEVSTDVKTKQKNKTEPEPALCTRVVKLGNERYLRKRSAIKL
jgi:hypothetical protein